jgi:hypothetical protein
MDVFDDTVEEVIVGLVGWCSGEGGGVGYGRGHCCP